MKKWIAACMASGLLATGAAFADPEAAPADEAAPAAEEATEEAADKPADAAEEAKDGDKADEKADDAAEGEKPEEAKGGKAQRSTAGNMDAEETDE